MLIRYYYFLSTLLKSNSDPVIRKKSFMKLKHLFLHTAAKVWVFVQVFGCRRRDTYRPSQSWWSRGGSNS